MDQRIPTRRSDRELINEKKRTSLRADYWVKIKESKWLTNTSILPETLKTVELEGDGDINYRWRSRNSSHILRKNHKDLEVTRRIVTGELRRNAVIQTPMKYQQYEKLMRIEIKIIIIIWEGKQLYGRFKRLINNITHQKTWTWLRKGNLKRETESLLIAAQDNARRTNHIKARIDKTQQNSNVGYAVTETKRSIT